VSPPTIDVDRFRTLPVHPFWIEAGSIGSENVYTRLSPPAVSIFIAVPPFVPKMSAAVGAVVSRMSPVVVTAEESDVFVVTHAVAVTAPSTRPAVLSAAKVTVPAPAVACVVAVTTFEAQSVSVRWTMSVARDVAASVT